MPGDPPPIQELQQRAYDAGVRATAEAVLKALREREQDLRWCMKDDDCDVEAEGVQIAISDVEEAVREITPSVVGIQFWECCGHQGCCEPAGIDKYHACKLINQPEWAHTR